MTASTPEPTASPRRRTITVLLLLTGLLAALFVGSGVANAAPARHHASTRAAHHVVKHHPKKHHPKHKKHPKKKHATKRPATKRPATKRPATKRPVPKPAPKPTPAPTAPGRTTGGTATVPARTATETSIGNAVLTQLNSERAANHLPALTLNPKLLTSARRHDLAMAQADEMSHQVAGEPALGDRVTAAGYRWSWAGENIGWNSEMTSAGALQLQTMMYNEVAPNDGHRLNILSSNYTDVGVDIYLDTTHHKLWLTTDFGRP